ncbi:hypothetical protein [Streptomyces sp. NPDC093610]|uniref:hypothetical protein n=1 Tax=Streptomyces sp. NPDC093610 TaxID=3366048 RepID=UPI00382A506B
MISRLPAFASLTFLIFFPLASIVGCSQQPEANETSSSGTPAETSDTGRKITDLTTKTIPIEEYLLSGLQSRILLNAEYQLRVRCTDHFGVTYPNTPPSTAIDQSIAEYRYGITDPKYAEKYGYRTPGARQSKAIEADIKHQEEIYKSLPDDVFLVLYGTSKEEIDSRARREYRGQEVPQGGCIGKAHRELYGSSGGGDAKIADDINVRSYTESTKDRKVQSAFSKWSTCMKAHGYDYEVPRDADNDSRWMNTKVTAAEKETAKIDAECKAEFDVVEIWLESDVSFQKKMIKKHAKEMSEIKKNIEEKVGRAKLILAKK